MGKVKGEHFVPQCYLKQFTKNEKINVYDKLQGQIRENQSVAKIAKQKAFYDFNEEEIEKLRRQFPQISEQYIEHYFSDNIEPALRHCIDKLHDYFIGDNNDGEYLLSHEFKMAISIQMSYQYLRTPGFRKNLMDLIGNNVAYIQKNMILNNDIIAIMVAFFLDKKWIININKTNKEVITSDNPIVIFDNVNGNVSIPAILSNNIKTIFYPCSSQMVIYLIDERVSSALNDLKIERRNLNNEFEIDFINGLQIRNANNFVFFNLPLEDMCFTFSKLECNADIERQWGSTIDRDLGMLLKMLEKNYKDESEINKINQDLKNILANIYKPVD